MFSTLLTIFTGTTSLCWHLQPSLLSVLRLPPRFSARYLYRIWDFNLHKEQVNFRRMLSQSGAFIGLISPGAQLLYGVVAIAVAACGFAAFLLRSSLPFFLQRQVSPSPEWLQEFNLSRYDALTRLFHPDDYEFLARQPGYTPELSARLRSERLEIAKAFLEQLEHDARLLINFANQSMATAVDDAGNFSGFVLKQEIQFGIRLALLRFQLGLMERGLIHRIQFDRLLSSIRPLALQSRALMTVSAGAL